MTIKQRGTSWQVDVTDTSALKGYQRIRKSLSTQIEAETVHKQIVEALEVYGKWPVSLNDRPRIKNKKTNSKTGTLRELAQIGLEQHWEGKAYKATIESIIWNIVGWFEDQGCPDIDDIKSPHLDKFVTFCRNEGFSGRGNEASTINGNLSVLGVLNTIGMKRVPKLSHVKLPIERASNKKKEQWWLRPDDMVKVVNHLRATGDDLFADIIELICHQGFRIMECLSLRERHFIGLRTDKPKVQVPGLKTNKSGYTIPVFDLSYDLVVKCVERANANGWERLFPITWRQARDRWQYVREYLGVADVPSATMKSLRRTFAAIADARGMTTKTLQEILRHENISTTEGYLNVIGAERTEHARKHMTRPIEVAPPPPPQEDNMAGLLKAIQAYKATGATPEEVARFTMEIMK